jgi:IS5 family transposase
VADGLNEALLAKAAEAKPLRANRIRADTRVVPANVAYPTDLGLLAKTVRRIAATGKRIQTWSISAPHRVTERPEVTSALHRRASLHPH